VPESLLLCVPLCCICLQRGFLSDLPPLLSFPGQHEARRHARHQVVRHGSLRESCKLIPIIETRTDTQHLTSFSQASSAEGKEGGIEFVQPPAASKPGERIYFEGAKFESQYPSHVKPCPQ
jgi:hypothetical protein